MSRFGFVTVSGDQHQPSIDAGSSPRGQAADVRAAIRPVQRGGTGWEGQGRGARGRGAVAALVAAAASVAVLGSGTARATDQGITGKKLLLKTGRLVLISKDASISIAGSDPVNGADSSVSFDDGGGAVPFSLPKTLWGTNGTGTLFKYKNALAPGSPSVVKVAKVKPGLLKVVAKGLPFAVPSGAATVDVILSLDGGTNTYCTTFGGTGDGDKFLVKDATPATAPARRCTAAGSRGCRRHLAEIQVG